jgi:hypothetical protein
MSDLIYVVATRPYSEKVCLWTLDEEEAQQRCKELNAEWSEGNVYHVYPALVNIGKEEEDNTIWMAIPRGGCYVGETQIYGDDRLPLPTKYFRRREDAEAYLEPLARESYKWRLSDLRANAERDEDLVGVAEELEEMGGFHVERKDDATLYWGPYPAYENCRLGECIGSVRPAPLE